MSVMSEKNYSFLILIDINLIEILFLTQKHKTHDLKTKTNFDSKYTINYV
jgi:hypothetical protein